MGYHYGWFMDHLQRADFLNDEFIEFVGVVILVIDS